MAHGVGALSAVPLHGDRREARRGGEKGVWNGVPEPFPRAPLVMLELTLSQRWAAGRQPHLGWEEPMIALYFSLHFKIFSVSIILKSRQKNNQLKCLLTVNLRHTDNSLVT